MASDGKTVRVGLGVIVICKDRILLGIRKGSHGAGKYQPPGGHLEYGESFQDCASREVLEETGLVITDPTYYYAVNAYMKSENKHYVTIFMKGYCEDDQEPKLMEPDKCEGWNWYTEKELREIPEDSLFMPMQVLLNQKDKIID